MTYKMLLGLPLLLLPTLTHAAPIAPLTIQAKYIVAWNGITIGRIRLNANETANSYSISVDTKTRGIGALFSNEKRIAMAEGKISADGRHIPSKYESRPQKETGEAPKYSILRYDNEGRIQSREVVPDDTPNYRPAVPAADVNLATDSVTAGLVLRRKLHGEIAKNGNTTSVKTYDGSRLAEMKFAVVKPEAKVEIMDNYVAAVNTVVTRTPIKGYTAKEMKKYNAGDPEIHLYFSDDEKFIPVKATINTSFGQLSATLDELQ